MVKRIDTKKHTMLFFISHYWVFKVRLTGMVKAIDLGRIHLLWWRRSWEGGE